MAEPRELGCFRLLVSEAHDGGTLSGNGIADAALLAAERGARLQPGPFVGTLVVVGTLSAAASTASHLAALEALASGEATATWAPDGLFAPLGPPTPPALLAPSALPTPPAGSGRAGAGGSRLTVRAAADGFTLSGVVKAVQDADDRDWILVSTRADGSTRQFLLPRSAAGLSLAKTEGLDITRRFFDLRLEDVRVPADAPLGDPATRGRAG